VRSATADLRGKPSKLCSSGDADLARVLAKICNTHC
jgi:hypothetical protein